MPLECSHPFVYTSNVMSWSVSLFVCRCELPLCIAIEESLVIAGEWLLLFLYLPLIRPIWNQAGSAVRLQRAQHSLQYFTVPALCSVGKGRGVCVCIHLQCRLDTMCVLSFRYFLLFFYTLWVNQIHLPWLQFWVSVNWFCESSLNFRESFVFILRCTCGMFI